MTLCPTPFTVDIQQSTAACGDDPAIPGREYKTVKDSDGWNVADGGFATHVPQHDVLEHGG
jgi:hypothetical protein